MDVQVKWAAVQEGEVPGALKTPKKFIFLCEAAIKGWEPQAGHKRWTLPKGGGQLMWMDWVLAAAWLALSSHSLLVQFDPVSIALFVRQTFVVSQDILYQETCCLIHVDVVLWKGQKKHVREVIKYLFHKILNIYTSVTAQTPVLVLAFAYLSNLLTNYF